MGSSSTSYKIVLIEYCIEWRRIKCNSSTIWFIILLCSISSCICYSSAVGNLKICKLLDGFSKNKIICMYYISINKMVIFSRIRWWWLCNLWISHFILMFCLLIFSFFVLKVGKIKCCVTKDIEADFTHILTTSCQKTDIRLLRYTFSIAWIPSQVKRMIHYVSKCTHSGKTYGLSKSNYKSSSTLKLG